MTKPIGINGAMLLACAIQTTDTEKGANLILALMNDTAKWCADCANDLTEPHVASAINRRFGFPDEIHDPEFWKKERPS